MHIMQNILYINLVCLLLFKQSYKLCDYELSASPRFIYRLIPTDSHNIAGTVSVGSTWLKSLEIHLLRGK